MRDPIHKTIPAWYEIDLEPERNDTFIVRIYNGALEEFSRVKDDAQIFLYYREKLGLQKFTRPGSEYIGFGNIFREIPCAFNGWTEYRARLPVVKGPREEDHPDWSELEKLRATLDVLFSALWLFEGDSGSQNPQLIFINSLAVTGHGGITATVAPAMVRFLIKHGEGDIREVVNAMRWTDEYMWQEKGNSYWYSEFRASVANTKSLHLSVPGQACGLDPDSFLSTSLFHGYELVPHNVDNGVQQMSFLRGLARLHSLARQSGM